MREILFVEIRRWRSITIKQRNATDTLWSFIAIYTPVVGYNRLPHVVVSSNRDCDVSTTYFESSSANKGD